MSKNAKEWRRLKQDATLIGDWEEIKALPLSSLTKNAEDTEVLDGLIVKGYETKFEDGTNTNGERYTKDSIDRFIQEYFVEKKLNMPVDIEHDSRPEWLAGRVIYIESNTTGFYYVAYIPRTYMHYEHVKSLLANKILQGFSKCGWATDWEWLRDPKTGEEYELVKEIMVVRMSIVSTPANGVSFEKVQEIQNATRFRKLTDEGDPDHETTKKESSAFAAMFNHK